MLDTGVDGAGVELEPLVEAAGWVEAPALAPAAGVGSATKVAVTAKAGSFGGQPPLPPAPPPEVDLVELCRVTLLTPSISRRR